MDKLVKLLPIHIPHYWDQIKFAVGQVTNISEEDKQKNYNLLLNNLLSERATCYLRIGENRILNGVFILRVNKHEITGDKTLVIDCMYSFKRLGDEEYVVIFSDFEELARKLKCQHITAWTDVPRIYELCNIVGMNEQCRLFTKHI